MKPIYTLFVLVLSALQLLGQSPSGDSTVDNISTEKNGAVVVYATPLTHGVSPNKLLSGQSLAFSKKGTKSHAIVIDLGHSYQFKTVQLKFAKVVDIKVYILKNKPDGNISWLNFVEGLPPNGILNASGIPVFLGGVQGQYLAIVSDKDPGTLSGLYVTGTRFASHQSATDFQPRDSNSLSEIPHPVSDFQPQSSGPSVPPQSH